MSEFTRREFLNDLKFWRIITWIDVYLMVFRWKCYSSHEKKKQQQFNDLIWVAQWKPRNAIVHNSNCRVLHTEWFDDMRHNFYLSTQYDKKKTGCGDSGSSSVNVVDSSDLYCLLFCRDIAHLSWHDCELPCIKNYANLFIFRFQRLCIVLILYFSNLHQRNPPNTRSFVRLFAYTSLKPHFIIVAITVSVIVFTYCFCVCPRFANVFHLFRSFAHMNRVKTPSKRIHFITIASNVRHKSINMKVFENEEQMLKFRLKLY